MRYVVSFFVEQVKNRERCDSIVRGFLCGYTKKLTIALRVAVKFYFCRVKSLGNKHHYSLRLSPSINKILLCNATFINPANRT